jgi:hypothetical protein
MPHPAKYWQLRSITHVEPLEGCAEHHACHHNSALPQSGGGDRGVVGTRSLKRYSSARPSATTVHTVTDGPPICTMAGTLTCRSDLKSVPPPRAAPPSLLECARAAGGDSGGAPTFVLPTSFAAGGESPMGNSTSKSLSLRAPGMGAGFGHGHSPRHYRGTCGVVLDK